MESLAALIILAQAHTLAPVNNESACRDAAGRFTQCPTVERCRDIAGRYASCDAKGDWKFAPHSSVTGKTEPKRK